MWDNEPGGESIDSEPTILARIRDNQPLWLCTSENGADVRQSIVANGAHAGGDASPSVLNIDEDRMDRDYLHRSSWIAIRNPYTPTILHAENGGSFGTVRINDPFGVFSGYNVMTGDGTADSIIYNGTSVTGADIL